MEGQLYETMIRAEHAYLVFMMPKFTEIFTKDTENREIDKDNIIYKAFFTKPVDTENAVADNVDNTKKNDNIENIEKKYNVEAVALYKELCLLVHPDKTQDPDDAKLFAAVHNAMEEGNVCLLKAFRDMLTKGVNRRILDELAKFKSEIDNFKRTIPYMWCTGHMFDRTTLDNMFCRTDK